MPDARLLPGDLVFMTHREIVDVSVSSLVSMTENVTIARAKLGSHAEVMSPTAMLYHVLTIGAGTGMATRWRRG